MNHLPRRSVDASPSPQGIYRPATNACVMGVGIFVLCLFGILSRPGGDLASFWPANAFLLGMLVRYPHFAHRGSWVAAALGFFLADALTGSPLGKNLILNLGNLVAIASGYWVFRQVDPSMHRLRSPQSVLYMLLSVVCVSFVAGLFGLYANTYLFNDRPIDGFAIWFATEMATDIAFLPLILTLPDWDRMPRHPLQWLRRNVRIWEIMPVLTLVLSAMFGTFVGGPGAIAFPVPALMWCAISYNLFITSFITFWVSAWTLVHMSMSLPMLPSGVMDRNLMLSIRMGLTLVMLTPIMIGSVMAANRTLVQRLRSLADLDQLTCLPSRRAFLELAHAQMLLQQQRLAPCAVLMLDIDHFKSVNDGHGHAAGDAVLHYFGDLLRECLRDQDIMGRLGGEEFAVLLPNTTADEAHAAAERIRTRFADSPIPVAGLDEPLRCTVSIGLAVEMPACSPFDVLLARADRALYQAKAGGRNLVAHCSGPTSEMR